MLDAMVKKALFLLISLLAATHQPMKAESSYYLDDNMVITPGNETYHLKYNREDFINIQYINENFINVIDRGDLYE